MPSRVKRVVAWPANLVGNPYIELLYNSIRIVDSELEIQDFSLRRILFGRWHIWHLHWPEFSFNHRNPLLMAAKVGVLSFLLIWAKLLGTKIIWTVHNLEAHERLYPTLEIWFKRWFTSRVDGVIAMTHGGAEQARERFPALRDKPLAVIPHGHYVDVYPNVVGRREARSKLGLSDQDIVFLYVGQIRSYKNVPALIEAFRGLNSPQVRLVIAGRPHGNQLTHAIENAMHGDPRILPYLRFVPDEELQLFMNAADLVVLPYQEILNSGSALMALSFGKPILVPNRGVMAELQATFGDNNVITYDGEFTSASLANVLEKFSAEPAEGDSLIQRVTEELAWGRIGEATVSFYRQVGGRPT